MKPEILFEEIQSSGRKGFRDFSRVITLIFLAALILNLAMQKGKASGFTAVLLVCLCIAALTGVAGYTSMVTQIRTDGIYVRFPPFQPSFTSYAWSSILDVHIRKFDAVSEYNGWGIRTGPMGKGYLILGDTGIQIVFKDKTRLLISTKRPQEVAEVLLRLGNFS